VHGTHDREAYLVLLVTEVDEYVQESAECWNPGRLMYGVAFEHSAGCCFLCFFFFPLLFLLWFNTETQSVES
jgi:hypothetical protein